MAKITFSGRRLRTEMDRLKKAYDKAVITYQDRREELATKFCRENLGLYPGRIYTVVTKGKSFSGKNVKLGSFWPNYVGDTLCIHVVADLVDGTNTPYRSLQSLCVYRSSDIIASEKVKFPGAYDLILLGRPKVSTDPQPANHLRLVRLGSLAKKPSKTRSRASKNAKH